MDLNKISKLFWKNSPKNLLNTKCWPWWKSLRKNGYGNCWNGVKNSSAHRVSFILHKGVIPDNKEIMHSCDNRDCVNPNHLFLGSKFDNMKDASIKGRLIRQPKKFCKNGHPFSVENTAYYDKKRPNKKEPANSVELNFNK